MKTAAFRGFTPVHSPCFFVNPIDQAYIYPYSRFVVIESQNGQQTILMENDLPISCIDMSPKGRMIATGESGRNSDILVWRYDNKSVLFRLSEHDSGVLAVAFSGDERLLATYGAEGRLIIWDMASGNIVTHKVLPEVHAIKWGGRVPDIKGRPTPTFYLATSNNSSFIELHTIDPSNGSITTVSLPMGKYSRNITSFAFTERYLLCASTSSDVLVFELHSLTLQHVFPVGHGGISYMYSAPDGGIIAGCGDGGIYSLSETTATLLSNCKHPISTIYGPALLTEDGRMILANGLQEKWQAHTTPITSIDCCNSLSVSVSVDRTVKVWNSNSLKARISFDSGFRSSPTSVSLSTHLLTVGFENGALGGFDFETGEKLFDILHCHHSAVSAVEIAPTRRFFATGGADYCVRLWDVKTRDMLTHYKCHEGYVSSVRFLPSSTHFYSSSHDRSICLLDVAKESILEHITGFESEVRDIDIAGDLLITATQDGHLAKFCISQSSKPIINLKTKEINTVSVSPDGSKFAVGHIDGSVSLWDLNSFKKISETVLHSESVSDIRFYEPNKILSAGKDGGLAVIQVQ